MILYSPIDEFEIHPTFIKILIFSYEILPINFIFFIFIFFIFIILKITHKKSFLYSSSFIISFFEDIYVFINQLVINNFKLNANISIYFPLLYFLFILILLINLLGIVPGGFTNTAFILHNFLITASIILGITFMGFFVLGFETYIHFFLIKGLPSIALGFLFILEVISHTAKAFSLSIRLFANMTAGHTLMHILAFGVLNFLKIPFFGIFGIIPLLVFLCVCLMEFGISFLQAYVFFILIVIYFNEAMQTSQFQIIKKLFYYGKEKKKKRKKKKIGVIRRKKIFKKMTGKTLYILSDRTYTRVFMKRIRSQSHLNAYRIN